MSKALNPESRAIRAIDRELDDLDLDAKERIVWWLSSRIESEGFWRRETERQRQVEDAIQAEPTGEALKDSSSGAVNG